MKNKLSIRRFSFAKLNRKAKGFLAGFVILTSASQFNPWVTNGYNNDIYNNYTPQHDYYQQNPYDYDNNPAIFQSQQYYGGDPRNYVALGQRYGAYVTPEQASLRFNSQKFGFQFVNASGSAAEPLALQPLNYNPYDYYRYGRSARWLYMNPAYKMVAYRDTYPGIDVAYQGDQQRFGYDFWTRPGGDPRTVVLAFNNVNQINVAPNGDLILIIDGKSLRCAKPSVYQQYDGTKQTIPASYRTYPDNRVGFDFGQYNPGQNLYMDPVYFDPVY